MNFGTEYDRMIKKSTKITKDDDGVKKMLAVVAVDKELLSLYVGKDKASPRDKAINIIKNAWTSATPKQFRTIYKHAIEHGIVLQPNDKQNGTQFFVIPKNEVDWRINMIQNIEGQDQNTQQAQPAGVPQTAPQHHVDPTHLDDIEKKIAEEYKTLHETGVLSKDAQKKLAEQQVDPAMATEHKALLALVAQLQHDNAQLREQGSAMASEFEALETENETLKKTQGQARPTSGNISNDGSLEIEDLDDLPRAELPQPTIKTVAKALISGGAQYAINVAGGQEGPLPPNYGAPPPTGGVQHAPTAPILLPAKGTAPAPPTGGGGGRPPNPPVNNNEVQATALVEAQTNALFPTQTNASLDEKESVLKDEHASKRQKQLGYNPKINWYGTEVQWHAIIKKLDDLPWHYPDPFDPNIRPWTPSQLDAVDPFL